MNTKAQVTAEAKRTLKRMKTKGWKIHVHRNIEWYWCLENLDGHLTLNPTYDGFTFYTLLSDGSYAHTGSINWSCAHTGPVDRPTRYEDPNDAVAAQLKAAQDYRDRTSAWINQVEDALK